MTRRTASPRPRPCRRPPTATAGSWSIWMTTTRRSRTSSDTTRRCTGGRPADPRVADAADRLREVYRQDTAAVRFDWGPIGAAAIAPGADVMVVVDVLSFTTTLSVAVDAGVEVFPYRFRDASAAAFAATRSAVLAVGRSERTAGEVSLSPLSVRVAGEPGGVLEANPRLVLPSPNGSAICRQLAETGATVVGACLRNAPSVASWIREQGFERGRGGRGRRTLARRSAASGGRGPLGGRCGDRRPHRLVVAGVGRRARLPGWPWPTRWGWRWPPAVRAGSWPLTAGATRCRSRPKWDCPTPCRCSPASRSRPPDLRVRRAGRAGRVPAHASGRVGAAAKLVDGPGNRAMGL